MGGRIAQATLTCILAAVFGFVGAMVAFTVHDPTQGEAGPAGRRGPIGPAGQAGPPGVPGGSGAGIDGLVGGYVIGEAEGYAQALSGEPVCPSGTERARLVPRSDLTAGLEVLTSVELNPNEPALSPKAMSLCRILPPE